MPGAAPQRETTRQNGARTPRRLDGTDLVLGFGPQQVVHGVGLRLVPGRVTALVGPNGSGKSTLLRGLARLHPLTGGGIELDAANALTLSPL